LGRAVHVGTHEIGRGVMKKIFTTDEHGLTRMLAESEDTPIFSCQRQIRLGGQSFSLSVPIL
ncbi:MAG: hypothetical protein L6437_11785, partial [Kiritimatiellae bacterium]|nr:hypothetical protein [Kiritimatiellia bacterium]